MSKPSIFSKDYERKMKKRRRITVLSTLTLMLIVGIVIFNTKIKNFDFTNVRANIQAWVDSGKTEEELEIENVEEEENMEEVVPEEVVPEELSVDIALSEGVTAKLVYIENNGLKEIQKVEVPEGYQFNISPQKDRVVFIDAVQNMKVGIVDGNVIDITKTEYISQAGTTFLKDQILQATPTYIWHSQAKFIDDNKVVYVSELPYFGNGGAKKYVWICDVPTNSHKTIWNFIGSDITIGEVIPEKGIEIMVNGVKYYMNANEEISN